MAIRPDRQQLMTRGGNNVLKKRTVAGCVVLAATLAPVQAAAFAQSPVEVTQPVQTTKYDLSPTRTYGVPDFAIDPEDPLHLIGSAVDMRTQRCGVMESFDGGQTWESIESSPSPDNYPLCLMTNSHTTQGKLAFGSDNRLYYALAGWDTQDGASRSILVGRSEDMGRSWQTTVVRDARGLEGEQAQPNRPLSGFAVDTSGDQDVLYLTWRQQNRLKDPNRLPNLPLMSVSTDGGATFSEPINLVGERFADAGARAEALNATRPSPSPVVAPAASPSAAASASPSAGASASPSVPSSAVPSTDPSADSSVAPSLSPAPSAAASPSAPPPAGTPASDPDQQVNFGGSNPVVAVDDSGTAYVAWVTSYQNIKKTPLPAHFLTRTSDQGKTTEVFQITPFALEHKNSFGGIDIEWSPEGGDDGTLHVVYEGSRSPSVSSEADVFYRQSTDRGQTWSDSTVINDDDPEQLFYSGIPQLSIAPDGRLDVAWFDTRSDPGVTSNDVYYAYSSDNGASWSKNVRISDQSIDRKLGVYAQNFDMNGPPGIASTNAYALVAWDDTRNFDSVTQGQDIYAAAVQFEELASGTSSTAKYVLAGVIGLLVVGALFVLLALLVKRRDLGRRPIGAT